MALTATDSIRHAIAALTHDETVTLIRSIRACAHNPAGASLEPALP